MNAEYAIVINENMYDASVRIVPADEAGYPYLDGWERAWGYYPSREAAEASLPEAKEYVAGRRLPSA